MDRTAQNRQVSSSGADAPELREYRTVDKAAWGAGPWQSEPDKRQWRDGTTGLPCLIVRGPSGALCGYVGVAPDHPAYGHPYDRWVYEDDEPPLTATQKLINNISVHGGLTYADTCGHGDESRTICHVPAPGEPDTVWWFGFDCAHAGDYSPAYGRLQELGRPTSWGGVVSYRDVAYVASEVELLAQQLLAIADGPEGVKASPAEDATRPQGAEGQ